MIAIIFAFVDIDCWEVFLAFASSNLSPMSWNALHEILGTPLFLQKSWNPVSNKGMTYHSPNIANILQTIVNMILSVTQRKSLTNYYNWLYLQICIFSMIAIVNIKMQACMPSFWWQLPSHVPLEFRWLLATSSQNTYSKYSRQQTRDKKKHHKDTPCWSICGEEMAQKWGGL